jgi:hypothetical protein
VYPPLSLSIKSFRGMRPDRAFPATFVRRLLKYLLLALDFLHTEAKAIHTGKSSKNEERTVCLLLIKPVDRGSYLNAPIDLQERKVIY